MRSSSPGRAASARPPPRASSPRRSTASAGPTPEPCNECSTCREIADGIAFDVLEIDGASHTQVDKMRDLMETVAHRPIKSRFKIYIIDEVHMLSSHSFNALLKTLEEPPPHVKFIFATTDPHKVLPTVVSRCQRYDLRRIGLGALHRASCGAPSRARGRHAARRNAGAGRARGRGQPARRPVAARAGARGRRGHARRGRRCARCSAAADRALVVAVADAVLAGDAAACLRQLRDAPRARLRRRSASVATCSSTSATWPCWRRRATPRCSPSCPRPSGRALQAQAGRRSADELQRIFGLLLETDETLAVAGCARSIRSWCSR